MEAPLFVHDQKTPVLPIHRAGKNTSIGNVQQNLGDRDEDVLRIKGGRAWFRPKPRSGAGADFQALQRPIPEYQFFSHLSPLRGLLYLYGARAPDLSDLQKDWIQKEIKELH